MESKNSQRMINEVTLKIALGRSIERVNMAPLGTYGKDDTITWLKSIPTEKCRQKTVFWRQNNQGYGNTIYLM